MDEYLRDLLARMDDSSDQIQILEPGYDSSKTISWQAFREAENLSNVKYIPQIIEYIAGEKNKDNRSHAYYILGQLTKNTNDKTGVAFLINQVDKEKDEHTVCTLLDIIAELEKSVGTNIEPILCAAQSDKSLLRHSAILALNGIYSKESEKLLIETLKTSRDSLDLVYANVTLSSMGTRECIPYLQELLSHKKRDVASSAFSAIIEVGGKDYIDLYREYLAKGKLKSDAISGVVAYGDESDIP
ncbi:MAG: hypothetical protein AAF518_29090, partial [Spirochaetota bacterium]